MSHSINTQQVAIWNTIEHQNKFGGCDIATYICYVNRLLIFKNLSIMTTDNLVAKPVKDEDNTYDVFKNNGRFAILYSDVKEYNILYAGEHLPDTILKEMVELADKLYTE